MAERHPERQVVMLARAELPEWTTRARRAVYAELFEGEEALLSPEELQLLDALDSELERAGGDGIWGTDQYGIHTSGAAGPDSSLGVVCVYHPQITSDSVLRGVDDLDDETEQRLNEALWQYGERVASRVEAELEAFVRRSQP